MDPDLCLRYLEAMGVRVWRPRTVKAEAGPDEPGIESQPRNAVEKLEGAGAVGGSVQADGFARAAGAPCRDSVAELDWEHLRAAVAACRACGLCETRNQTVFGVGNRRADLMVIGEAPGADEDRQGEPFVGQAGQLLNLMLAAIGLRREDVYIANILKCRPPGNRDPMPEEALRCEPFLMRQIALLRPRVLLSVGRISAQNLLRTDAPIGRLRGRWFDLGPDKTPLMVTYHPAYLLRSPEQKGRAWQDLLQVAHRLRSASGRAGALDDAS
jgi:uracil-DNA glycosylase family 4